MTATTPADLLLRERRRDPTRPLLTWYDDASGERVELSVATASNWVSKIANMLVDDYDVAPGDTVSVVLPLHWETAVLLLAVWVAGAHVVAAPDAAAVVTATQASAVTAQAAGAAAVISFDLAPMGAGLARLVAAQPDELVAPVAVDAAAKALTTEGRTWSHGDLGAAALAAAAAHRLDATTRVLSTLPYTTATGLDAGLLVPLAAGGSVVLVRHPDEAALPERCRVERVTQTAGIDVPGVPRLDRHG